MSRPYRFDVASMLLSNALSDLSILAGESIGPSDAGWQDVAGTAAANLHALANMLEAARAGNVADGPVVFPSPSELMAILDA